MYRNRSDGIGQTIGGILLMLGLAQWISELFRINYFLALGIVFGGGFGILYIAFGISSLRGWWRRVKPCVHGVRDNGIACDICRKDRELQNDIRNRQIAQYEAVARIKREAQQLRSEEIQRLSKAWLSHADTYYAMSPRQFEDAIGELFRRLGYQVRQTPYSNDSGRDAILVKDGKTFLVECKRYSASTCIGRPDIQKFVAAMHDENAVGGFYVNTGRYSPEARKYATAHDIVVYDRHTFPSLVLQAYPVSEDATTAKTMCLDCGTVMQVAVEASAVRTLCPNGHAVINTITPFDLRVFSPTGEVPACETCGAPMRVRKGRRGQFWSCSEYPKCRFTRRFASRATN